MTPYSRERPRGRLVADPVTGRFHVEWSAVEKDAKPVEPIRFQKDDTAISGKKQAKDSLKRAKKDRNNRLKAEAAAEENRENLNKGDEMKDPIIRVAKAMLEKDYIPRTTTKKDFYE